MPGVKIPQEKGPLKKSHSCSKGLHNGSVSETIELTVMSSLALIYFILR